MPGKSGASAGVGRTVQLGLRIGSIESLARHGSSALSGSIKIAKRLRRSLTKNTNHAEVIQRGYCFGETCSPKRSSRRPQDYHLINTVLRSEREHSQFDPETTSTNKIVCQLCARIPPGKRGLLNRTTTDCRSAVGQPSEMGPICRLELSRFAADAFACC
jgi:hypothetical protein